MPDALLTARGVEAGYGSRQILFGVDLDVAEGEVVALLGANGSGKSTLLNAVSGFVQPRRGSIRLDGVELAGLPPHRTFRRGIVQVSQARDLLLDEPSGGLAPAFVTEIAAIVAALKQRRVTMMIVEQNLRLALSVADRILVLRDGVVVEQRTGQADEETIVRQIYL